jgi:hypothetical protein
MEAAIEILWGRRARRKAEPTAPAAAATLRFYGGGRADKGRDEQSHKERPAAAHVTV